MKLANRTRRERFWKLVWVARRYLELMALDWELMLRDCPELREVKLSQDSQFFLHREIQLGD